MAGEFDLIRRYFQVADNHSPAVILGIGDDAALLTEGDGELAVAMDALVAGVHFPDAMPAADIGYRALAVNLSDLAAMGATPVWATLALTLPNADEAWLAGFAEGFLALARKHAVSLVGGDTVRGPLQICVTVGGRAARGTALRRSGGRPGDGLWLSGACGLAALGLTQYGAADADAAAREAFARPRPRVELGRRLTGIASAAIDVSDGLAADVGHLASASGCAAVINAAALPVPPALARLPAAWRRQLQLSGGDDYELCFAAPPAQTPMLEALSGGDGLPPLTLIGRLGEGQGVTVLDAAGLALAVPAGYDHFGP